MVNRLTATLVLLVLLVMLTTGCASSPPVQHLVVPPERAHIPRPELPVERLTQEADAAQVFQAYRESLLLCIGYAKQLEAAHP